MSHSGSSSLTPSASIRLSDLGPEGSRAPTTSTSSSRSSSSSSPASRSSSSEASPRRPPMNQGAVGLNDDEDGPFYYGPGASSSALDRSGVSTSSGVKGKARELVNPHSVRYDDDEGPFVDPEHSSSGSGSSSASSSGSETGRHQQRPSRRQEDQRRPSPRAGLWTPRPASEDERTPSPTHFLSPTVAGRLDVDEGEAGPLLPLPTVASTDASGQGSSNSGAGGADRRQRRRSHRRRDDTHQRSSSRRNFHKTTSLRDRVAAAARWGWTHHASSGAGRRHLADKERALWEWVNVDDLDEFLGQVYDFYLGKGFFCILLARGLNLVTVGFVIVFSSFLLRCVDYGALAARSGLGEQWALDEVLVPRCASTASFGAWVLSLLFFTFYAYQLASFARSIPRLLALHRFFKYLLEMPDEDIQTTNWNDVVRAIEGIREANSATSAQKGAIRLDAHDIANRLMRQENYLIALLSPGPATVGSGVPVATPPRPRIDLSLSHILPVWTPATLRERQWLTRVVVWNLRFCLLGFLFDGGAGGEVRRGVLRSKGNRAVLAEALRRRLRFMALVNVILGPAIAVYLVIYSFFRYFEEYHKNPSSIGGRAYTSQARWLFREYNELPHLFERRLAGSLPIARKYVDQFPKERTALIMRFISFIAGSFAAVLLLLTILDPAALLALEITPHRSVLFYLTLFGGVLAVTRTGGEGGSEGRKVYDPEVLMRGVEYFTHWMPADWEGRLHSTYVLDEFSRLFTLKVVVFLSEIASVFLTPILLWRALPAQAESIVDFFREFTIHVEGVGHVCSFAVFDFGRVGKGKGRGNEALSTNPQRPDGHAAKLDRTREREPVGGKMERSFLNFKANNPEWTVQDPTSSIFLSRLQEQQSSHLLATGDNGRQPFHPTQQPKRPREGVMQASYYLAEHNVPAFAGLASGLGSPLPQNESTPSGIKRGSGPGGRHTMKPLSRQALVLQEDLAEDEHEVAGWDDVADEGRRPSGSEQPEGRGEDGDDDNDGEDQDLLRLLGAIGSTRLGR